MPITNHDVRSSANSSAVIDISNLALPSHKENRKMNSKFLKLLTAVVPVVALMAVATMAKAQGPPVPGAIFTTDSTCSGVDLNIYHAKGDVYLNGGPTHPTAASLNDGAYYVQVTNPSGSQVLGSSLNTGTPQPFVVSGGVVQGCLQLCTIAPNTSGGCYDNTDNLGGEYKVWVSNDPGFANNSTKTDNFKVVDCTDCGPQCDSKVKIRKFYANPDGTLTTTEIFGWKVTIHDQADFGDHSGDVIRYTPVNIQLADGTYDITEATAAGWIAVTPTTVPVTVNGCLLPNPVNFGNVCLGGGGGLTLGFWSNKNGQKIMDNINGTGTTAATLTFLTSLNLRNGAGANFDPTTYTLFRNWILAATATNMSYMLSAQLAAMELNVRSASVDGTAIIYAPGTVSGGVLGFASVNAVMAEANALLGSNGSVLTGNSLRPLAEALKNALDQANNNNNFVQVAGSCPLPTFP
jgi:hypothetical protein